MQIVCHFELLYKLLKDGKKKKETWKVKLQAYIKEAGFHLLQASFQNFGFALITFTNCFHVTLHNSSKVGFPEFIPEKKFP